MPFDERKRWTQGIRDTAPRQAQKSHPAFEPSEPPPPIEEPWGHPVEGQGSPSVMAPPINQHRVEAQHKAFVGVWGIVAILVGAAGGGWLARAFAGDYVTSAQQEVLKRDIAEIKANVGSVRETQIGMQKDVEWMKEAIRAAQVPEPLEVKKKR